MDPDPESPGSPGASHSRKSPSKRRPSATVEVARGDLRWPASTGVLLARAARAAFAAAAPAAATGEIGLVLADDAEVRRLNKAWRGKDRPTNVLSFPLRGPGAVADPAAPLGDVVLAYETVGREAADKGIPLAWHATHLVVHGVLHLLGHDHGEEEEARAMESLETGVLAGLGIPDPHAGASDRAVGEMAEEAVR